MVFIPELWLAILVSAVLVFITSAIVRTVLPYHKTDFKALPGEAEIRRVMREQGVQPGDYAMPFCSAAEMKDPDVVRKFEEGPVGLLFVRPSGAPTMGKELTLWFILCLVVSFTVAYVTGRALGPEAEYLEVFRFAATAAFLGYGGLGVWQETIWFSRSTSTTLKNSFDALLFGLVTAGVFGWLWP